MEIKLSSAYHHKNNIDNNNINFNENVDINAQEKLNKIKHWPM